MDDALYERAIAKPLDEKVEIAIANIQHYRDTARTWDMFEPWYHLCNSFGKDSAVAEWLMRQSGVEFQGYHSLTTLDAPELIRHGREHYPDTIIAKPKVPLLHRLAYSECQGPPTRLARWCCEIYKEQGCKGQIKVFGVRAEESYNRKQNWRLWRPHRTDGSWILNPILYWTEDDVWTLIRREGIPYCSLYDEGFKRLGCIGCPMSGKGRVKEWERWPKYKDGWCRAFSKFWQTWHGVPLERPRWVSMEGKYRFQPLPAERLERRYVSKSEREEDGFWTLRRWYDLKGYETWEDLWRWWMEDEAEPEGCAMGQW
jgi:phosphoadenosine phosphosulfate reductase